MELFRPLWVYLQLDDLIHFPLEKSKHFVLCKSLSNDISNWCNSEEPKKRISASDSKWSGEEEPSSIFALQRFVGQKNLLPGRIVVISVISANYLLDRFDPGARGAAVAPGEPPGPPDAAGAVVDDPAAVAGGGEVPGLAAGGAPHSGAPVQFPVISKEKKIFFTCGSIRSSMVNTCLLFFFC